VNAVAAALQRICPVPERVALTAFRSLPADGHTKEPARPLGPGVV
jgi:hypothetical protein